VKEVMYKDDMRIAMAIVLWSLFAHPASAQQTRAQEAPLTDNQQSTLSEGIRLHDARQYDDAIERYREILAQNPRSAVAWYQLGYAQFAKGDWTGCQESARQGLEFESRTRIRLQNMLASCLDQAGQPRAALDVYNSLLQSLPANLAPQEKALIHFNAGATHLRQQGYDEARRHLQAALELNPRHSSSHFQLASVYLRSNRPIPAILALGMFLTLEPAQSPRAASAASTLRELLDQQPTQTGPNNFSMSIPRPTKGDPEGDFSVESAMLALAGAADTTDKSRRTTTTDYARLVSRWTSLLDVLLDDARAVQRAETFSGRFYVPFYRTLVERQLAGAFVSAIFQTASLSKSADEEKAARDSAEAYRRFVANWGAGIK
jgi:tetratricopeptide (TPR) repeat protein